MYRRRPVRRAIAVGTIVVGAGAGVTAVGHAVGVVINRVIKAFAKITVIRYIVPVSIEVIVKPRAYVDVIASAVIVGITAGIIAQTKITKPVSVGITRGIITQTKTHIFVCSHIDQRGRTVACVWGIG